MKHDLLQGLNSQRGGLRGFFRSRRVPGHEIDDLIQQCFEVLVRRHECVGEGQTRAFLMGVARNVLRAYFRGANSVNETENDSVDEQIEAAGGYSPLAIAARRELTGILEKAVRGLSPQHRRVLELRYFEGRSGADTARDLGLSRQTVHEYERLGLQRLRTVLGPTNDMHA